MTIPGAHKLSVLSVRVALPMKGIEVPLSFTALRVVNYLASKGSSGQVVPESMCAREDLASVHVELAGHGLIINDDRLGGDPTFAVITAAQSKIRVLAKQYRQAAIQLEILTKIKSRPDAGETDDYFPPTEVDGDSVERIEFDRAVSHLQDWDLIKGIKYWGEGLIRPILTPNGYEVLDSGLSPKNWVETQGRMGSMTTNYGDTNSHTNNFSGPVGSYQQGDHNSATVNQTIGIDGESFKTILEQIRQMLQAAGLDADTLDAATTQLELIEQQAGNGASQGRVKTFFSMLAAALPAALAGEIADLAGQAISILPA